MAAKAFALTLLLAGLASSSPGSGGWAEERARSLCLFAGDPAALRCLGQGRRAAECCPQTPRAGPDPPPAAGQATAGPAALSANTNATGSLNLSLRTRQRVNPHMTVAAGRTTPALLWEPSHAELAAPVAQTAIVLIGAPSPPPPPPQPSCVSPRCVSLGRHVGLPPLPVRARALP